MDLVPLAEMPAWLLVVLGVLVVAQVSLEVYALIVLFRTPTDRLEFGKRWPWLLIILLVNLLGAIVFLVAGRKPEPAAESTGSTGTNDTADRASRAVDALYGPPDGGAR